MHYYKRNIGDYHRKAGRLNILQHGVYNLLIDACYDRESFPTRQEAIDWVWAESDEEIAAVDYVLKKFFTLDDDGRYIQSHIQEDLEEYFAGLEAENTKRGNEAERQQRHRERRKEMFAQLREHGITPPYNTKMQDLQAMCDKLKPVTVETQDEDGNNVTDDNKDMSGVTDNVTGVTGGVTGALCVTEATAITTNQEPLTKNHKPIKKNMSDPAGSNDTESPPVPDKPDKNKILNAQAKEIFDHWKTVFGKTDQCKYTDDRKNKILARLRDGYTVDHCKRAIDGCGASEYHRAGNYTSIDLIFRNGGHLERFREMPLTPDPGMQQPSQQQGSAQQSGAEAETYSALTAEPGNYNPDMYKPAKPFVPEVSNLTPEEQAEAQRRIFEMAEQLKGGKS